MRNIVRMRLWAALAAGWLAAAPAGAAAGGEHADRTARQVLEAAGVRGGLVVHVAGRAGPGGELTAALRTGEALLVHGLYPTEAGAAKARAIAAGRGMAGKVTASAWPGGPLPFIDNVVNVLVVEEPARVDRAEAMRVLAPGGVLCEPAGGSWKRTVKPGPGDIDEWTHYLHDAGGNAVAHDLRVGPPRRMQWLADPPWIRSHHKLASISAVVAAGGRLFYIVDEGPPASMAVPSRWFLAARDAFNGTLLWKRPLASWSWSGRKFRSGPVQLPRTLVADGGRVYAPLGLEEPLAALDAADGRTVRTYEGTKGTEEVILHDGVLLVVVGSPAPEQALGGEAGKAGPFPNSKAILAFQAGTGRRLWRWAEPADRRLVPLTLAAAGNRAYFQAGGGVCCLALDSGRAVWQTPTPAAPAAEPKQPSRQARRKGATHKRKPAAGRGPGWALATLVVADGVVLSSTGTKLTALAAETGKILWGCPVRPGFRSPTDVFVIDGLVWTGSDFSEARDLHSGEVKRTSTVMRALRTAGHHHRCYREKATDRYILGGHRGIELFDLRGENHSRNNWVRGLCQYGILPCNGLIYAPPHACGCYMEGKLMGFWALAGAGSKPPVPAGEALVRGEAFGQVGKGATAGGEAAWPTLRGDALRSGSTRAALPTALRPLWRAKVGGRLTPPVAADGVVVVAAGDEHRVVALDAATGRTKWTFLAGGRVDSPPTLYNGAALFGGADGWVYCLRLADGAVAWRFRAAPAERLAVARDQVESVWPLAGSVLIQHGRAYVAAGRDSYLDDGLVLYALDPATGAVLARTPVRNRHPRALEGATSERPNRFAQNATDSKTFNAPDHSDAFSMSAVRNDVLVGDGESVYLRHLRFDRDGRAVEKKARHLFSTSRLTDDAENHRSHWVLGTGDFSRTPVAYSWIANSLTGRFRAYLAVPYGLMLAFDGEKVWGVRRGGKAGGYTLFAQRHGPLGADEPALPDFRQAASGRKPPWEFSVDLPVRPRAILHARGRLVLAAVPGLAEGRRAFEAFEGRKDGLLWLASDADGSRLGEHRLPAAPVWDGLAAAGGRLLVCLADGSVLCLGGR